MAKVGHHAELFFCRLLPSDSAYFPSDRVVTLLVGIISHITPHKINDGKYRLKLHLYVKSTSHANSRALRNNFDDILPIFFNILLIRFYNTSISISSGARQSR